MAELKITRENFENEVMKSNIPVLIDFWAPWCGPCQMMGPIIEQLAEEYEGKAKVGKVNVDEEGELFGKVNVDEEGELSQAFGVMSIPTIVLVKDGKVVRQAVGARPKAEVEAMLQ